jgi:hypothetical protein
VASRTAFGASGAPMTSRLAIAANRRVGMGRASVDADDLGADPVRDLRGGAADAAARADQRQRFALQEPRRLDKSAPSGHEIDADRSRLIEIEGARLVPQARDGNRDALGMRALAGKADIPSRAPHFGADPLGWPSFHHAGEITPGYARQRRLFHRAFDVLHVARIDRGRFDADDRRRVVSDRIGDLDDFKRLDIAERLDLNGSHGTDPVVWEAYQHFRLEDQTRASAGDIGDL